MLLDLIALLLDAAIMALFLWLGMKAVATYMGMGKSAVYCKYWQLLVASSAAALVGLVPSVGFVFSIIVLFALMMKFTEAGFVEVLLMVGIAKFASIFALLFILPMLGVASA